MTKIAACIAVFLSLPAVSQERPPKVVVVPSTPAAGPQWDKGVVEDGTYKNASIGLELTPPSALELGTPELKGNPGTVPLLVTITAVSAPNLFAGRDAIAFYADALAYYPANQRSTEAYLRKAVQGNQSEGFEPLDGSSESTLGGAPFMRQDFQKGLRYEAVLVKACKAQAIVFIFASSQKERVNKLIGDTHLKLDLGGAGCGSNSASPGQK